MQKPRRKYDYYVGIDTGVNTGYAIWESAAKRFIMLRTVPIHEAMRRIEHWATLSDDQRNRKTFIRVEDARKAVFDRSKEAHKLRGAGSVMRDAKIWEDYLASIGADFEMVRPNGRLTKMAEDQFARTTGWTEPCSSHARDAAMLVYGY